MTSLLLITAIQLSAQPTQTPPPTQPTQFDRAYHRSTTSGRPLVVPEALAASDAFAAVWLPGTEGDGIADVLFGDHAPTGKLSFSWPRTADQHPINVGDEDYDPLFPYGFGLSW